MTMMTRPARDCHKYTGSPLFTWFLCVVMILDPPYCGISWWRWWRDPQGMPQIYSTAPQWPPTPPSPWLQVIGCIHGNSSHSHVPLCNIKFLLKLKRFLVYLFVLCYNSFSMNPEKKYTHFLYLQCLQQRPFQKSQRKVINSKCPQ